MNIKICSLRRNKNNWELLDCNNEIITNSLDQMIFPSSMNRRYRMHRTKYISNEELSCVWFLMGYRNEQELWIQVGRTKNLTNLLSNDVKEDIKDFYRGNGKYGRLKEKAYDKFVFYEVDIKDYIHNDINAIKILGKEPKDENLKKAYWVNCAAYIEGKLASENKVEYYHPSTLDGYFYSYFKNNNFKLYRAN